MPQYKKVRFIGHAINTGCRKLKDGTWDYVGLDEPRRDVAARLKVVEEALKLAHDKAKTDDETTLRVFVMPEFFFRGKVGAYMMGRPEIDDLIDGLQGLVKDPKWRHWFCVFGSAVGMSVPDKGKFEGYNYTLCQAGGFGDAKGAGPKAAHAVVKEHMSGIDFIHDASKVGDEQWLRGRYGVLADQIEHLKPANATGSEVQQRSYGGECIFEHYDLTWGVEICLDHLVRRIKKSTGAPAINLQVVPSCGASLEKDSVVVRKGYAFNCDGLNNSGFPSARGNAHTLLWSMKDGKVNPIKKPEAVLPLSMDVSNIFADGPGELHVYAPLPLP